MQILILTRGPAIMALRHRTLAARSVVFGDFHYAQNAHQPGARGQNGLMKNQHHNRKYSALRARLKREDAARLAKLTPAERLQGALDLSDFCLTLAAKVRESDAQRSSAKNRRTPR